MQEINTFHWAQDKLEEVVTSKKHREQAACERRLRQMQARREKEAARNARRASKAHADGV